MNGQYYAATIASLKIDGREIPPAAVTYSDSTMEAGGLSFTFGEGSTVQGSEWGFGAEHPPGTSRGKAASRRGLKRPGQWGWQAREKRSRRLWRAERRRKRERDVRDREYLLFNRRTRRKLHRAALESLAWDRGLTPYRGEFSAALACRMRLMASRASCAFTSSEIEAATGGKVTVDVVGRVLVTMPEGTTVEQTVAVRSELVDLVPDYVSLEVV